MAGDEPYTLSLEFTVAAGLTRGQDYTFRYRASNQVGAGPWSEISIVKAAGVPPAPSKPKLIASEATSITLQFD